MRVVVEVECQIRVCDNRLEQVEWVAFTQVCLEQDQEHALLQYGATEDCPKELYNEEVRRPWSHCGDEEAPG